MATLKTWFFATRCLEQHDSRRCEQTNGSRDERRVRVGDGAREDAGEPRWTNARRAQNAEVIRPSGLLGRRIPIEEREPAVEIGANGFGRSCTARAREENLHRARVEVRVPWDRRRVEEDTELGVVRIEDVRKVRRVAREPLVEVALGGRRSALGGFHQSGDPSDLLFLGLPRERGDGFGLLVARPAPHRGGLNVNQAEGLAVGIVVEGLVPIRCLGYGWP